MSWLVAVAHSRILRLFMKGKFDAYILWPLAKGVQNWIVDWSTARNFMVSICFLGVPLNNISFVLGRLSFYKNVRKTSNDMYQMKKISDISKHRNGTDSIFLILNWLTCNRLNIFAIIDSNCEKTSDISKTLHIDGSCNLLNSFGFCLAGKSSSLPQTRPFYLHPFFSFEKMDAFHTAGADTIFVQIYMEAPTGVQGV